MVCMLKVIKLFSLNPVCLIFASAGKLLVLPRCFSQSILPYSSYNSAGEVSHQSYMSFYEVMCNVSPVSPSNQTFWNTLATSRLDYWVQFLGTWCIIKHFGKISLQGGLISRYSSQEPDVWAGSYQSVYVAVVLNN